MAEEDIVIRIVQEAKSLQEKIDKSSLPRANKDLLSARLTEALSRLDKGTNATAKDLNIVSANLKIIINELVKTAARAQKLSPAFKKAQQQIESARNQRDQLTKESSKIRRTKITNEGKLRTSEADRLVSASGILNDRGAAIKTYSTLTKFAKSDAGKNNQQVVVLLEKINAIEQQFVNRLNEIQTKLIPQADADIANAQAIQKTLVPQKSSGSTAVQVQQFGNELQELIDQLKKSNEELRVENASSESGVDPAQDLQDIKNLNQETTKTSGTLGKAFKQFSLYAIVFRNIKRAVNDAINTITSLDASLTEQAMVIGKTRQQTYALLSTYQDIAIQTGATTREVSSLVTEFVRQGKTTDDALTLTQAAMSAAKVASISAADSVNYLTTALNGFGLSAEDAMSVSDKFAMVAASSATSYDELATALSKVASQANLAGMSIDYTTALLAKGLETTREAPETMGTALKTIIARMREIGDYGETLEGDTDLNNVESQLAYVGIALRSANGELRSTEDVLDELGRKWDTLNSNQQAAVAKALAGTRQQSRLIAMMSDYERVIELQQISERSSGATLSQMSTYLQGIDAALNNVSVE